MLRIAEGLYLLEAGGFVNSYLISGGGELTLVDAGHSRCAEALLGEIVKNGFKLADIVRVVLTHAHADHVGAVGALLKRHWVRVLAHPRDIPVLMGNAPQPHRGPMGFMRAWLREYFYPWSPMDVVVPIEPGMSLRGLPQWQVFHTPGHTSGSLSLFNPVQQILLCGDALVHHRGRLSLPAACLNQDQAEARKTLEALAKLDSDVLCCGHGPILRGGAFRHIEALLGP